jgi:GTPase SAR1 family protein
MRKSTGPALTGSNAFTVLMVGYYATGKSAILSRFLRGTFEE